MQSETDNVMAHIAIAARAMTGAEPPADLEARIKRRLDQVTASAAPRRWPRYAALAAGAAVLVAGILVHEPEVPQSRRPEVPTSRSAEVVAVPGPRDLGTSGPRASGTSGPRDLGTSGLRISDTEQAWMARRIPALETVETLAVAPLVFESIQPEPMSITPLTMTPLVTSPVSGDPDGGRQQ
jgi:hypothetical protein